MEKKITIDKATLKAIVVDTRLEILKSLGQKQKTLSDLSKELGLSAATLKEHLDILLNVNLIKKDDERKWKYYSLTFKGLNIVNPQETKALFSFVLGSLLTIGVFLFLLTAYVGNYQTSVSRSVDNATDDILVQEVNVYDQVNESTHNTASYEDFYNNNRSFINVSVVYLILFITLFLFTSYVGVFYFTKRKKRKR